MYMLAVLKEKPENESLAVKEVPEPKLKPGCLIAKVDACGICGTDVHIYKFEGDYPKRLGSRLPMVMGHEFTGVITAIDEETEDLKVGTRIVASPGVACGQCYYCKTGAREICENRLCTGIETEGAMAEYVLMQKENCFAMPLDFPVDVAATIEPMSIAYNALDKAGSLLGKDVVVIGPGTIGYFACLFAHLAGAANISIIGLPQDEERLQIAQSQISNINIYTDGGSSFKPLDGVGADVVFEVSGSAGGLNSAVALAKKRAVIVEIGIPSKQLNFDALKLVRNELVLRGTHAMSHKLWMELVNLLASLPESTLGKFQAAVTHKFSITEAKQAFSVAAKFEGLKVLIFPQQI